MPLPACTYRIQFQKDFNFRDLEQILDYLQGLGITTIYASPLSQAVAGSVHGYDVTNAGKINPELGTREDMDRVSAKMKERSMSWLQDIIPNHMATDMSNAWLQDVVERGMDSPFYQHFDIDWTHPDPELKGRMMVPVLGEPLAQCLEKKEIRLEFGEAGFAICYGDHRYPISLDSYNWILGKGNTSVRNLDQDLLSSRKEELGSWTRAKSAWLERIRRRKEICGDLKQVADQISGSAELMSNLLDRQHLAFVWWKEAESRIDFRRFFTVNSLICLNMADEKVREDYHELYLELATRGLIQGLRIDHLDGLSHPGAYLAWLRENFGEEFYIVAEKILAADETLPESWPIEGTTGYDFLAEVSQLLTHEAGAAQITAFYRELVGLFIPYEDLVYDKKLAFLTKYMGGELDNLFRLALVSDPSLQAMDRDRWKNALASWMSSLPVYRLYPGGGSLSESEQKQVRRAFEMARRRSPGLGQELDLLACLLRLPSGQAFFARLMQFTVPLAAKGVEDTSFYVYNPLVSHNEVGDSPAHLGRSPEWFHDRMVRRLKRVPHSLNATATHDTKRGEDGRMRLNALSGCAEKWESEVLFWMDMNEGFIQQYKGERVPDLNEEYTLYQALVSGFPENGVADRGFIDRLKAYFTKVLREAKTHTSWEEPAASYEKDCLQFIENILSNGHPFARRLSDFLEGLMEVARRLSLSQLLLKLTAPGIPDIYMGSELWDTSYVDPDNRRIPDYSQRLPLVEDLALPPDLGEWNRTGQIKLFLLSKVMAFRSSHSRLFESGTYEPVPVSGGYLAYQRRLKGLSILIVVPLVGSTGQPGMEYPHPEAVLDNLLTGQTLDPAVPKSLEENLQKFPVGLFIARGLEE